MISGTVVPKNILTKNDIIIPFVTFLKKTIFEFLFYETKSIFASKGKLILRLVHKFLFTIAC